MELLVLLLIIILAWWPFMKAWDFLEDWWDYRQVQKDLEYLRRHYPKAYRRRMGE